MEKLFTERAHLMCPRMNFGIAVSIDRAFETGRIKDVLERTARNHSFLRAVIGYNEMDNSYFYAVRDSSMIDLKLSEDTLTGLDDPELIREYDRLTGCDWDIMKEGLLKVAAWSMQGKTAMLLVFHHLLADGRGALSLAEEIAEAYVENKIRWPVAEKLISSERDLPENSGLPLISRMLINKANRDWAREGNKLLSYQRYHEYADRFVKNDKIRISLKRTPAGELSGTVRECRKHSVTLNDLLMARMYQDDDTDKIVIARDLREQEHFRGLFYPAGFTCCP